MRINVDRLCELAGVPGARRSQGGLIREAADQDAKEEYGHMSEMAPELESALEEDMSSELEDALPEGDEHGHDEGMHADHDMSEMDREDEVLDIDEADLVKELRRIKVKMHEARKIEKRRQEDLQESQLKAIIDQEVKNVLKELNLNSGWIYGKNKPLKSKKGYTHQGSFLKGFGFK
jgi:hypothetical protein